MRTTEYDQRILTMSESKNTPKNKQPNCRFSRLLYGFGR